MLTLPYELRKLVAFKADVLTAVARIFVESVFASYRARAKRNGVEAPQCGAVNFVQRCGSSVNLHVHYHLVALDGVFARDAHGHVVFHPAPPPTPADLEAIIERTARRTLVGPAPPRLRGRLAARSPLQRAAGADRARRLRGHRHGARQRDDDAT